MTGIIRKGKKPEDTSKKYWEVDVWIENQRWHKHGIMNWNKILIKMRKRR
mgnify:CR=1 FL=1